MRRVFPTVIRRIVTTDLIDVTLSCYCCCWACDYCEWCADAHGERCLSQRCNNCSVVGPSPEMLQGFRFREAASTSSSTFPNLRSCLRYSLTCSVCCSLSDVHAWCSRCNLSSEFPYQLRLTSSRFAFDAATFRRLASLRICKFPQTFASACHWNHLDLSAGRRGSVEFPLKQWPSSCSCLTFDVVECLEKSIEDKILCGCSFRS